MRDVVEVESGPPNEAVQRALLERVGPEVLEAAMRWAQKLREEGREEGLQRGREEGQRLVQASRSEVFA